jgi:hypothetical protein
VNWRDFRPVHQNNLLLLELSAMKATAAALLGLSAYWVAQGVLALQKQDTSTGLEFVGLGLVLLPLAKYLWGKNLGPKP